MKSILPAYLQFTALVDPLFECFECELVLAYFSCYFICVSGVKVVQSPCTSLHAQPLVGPDGAVMEIEVCHF